MIYFYSFSDTTVAAKPNASEKQSLATGTVGHLEPNAAYRYQWFDPITGEYAQEGTFRVTRLGTYFIGNKPSGTDWALRIIRI